MSGETEEIGLGLSRDYLSRVGGPSEGFGSLGV